MYTYLDVAEIPEHSGGELPVSVETWFCNYPEPEEEEALENLRNAVGESLEERDDEYEDDALVSDPSGKPRRAVIRRMQLRHWRRAEMPRYTCRLWLGGRRRRCWGALQ